MQSWKLIPFAGIKSDMGQLVLEMTINEVEEIIGSSGKINNQNEIHQFYGTHIMLQNVLGTGCSLMFEYQDNKLFAIRFYDGSLMFEDIELCKTNISDLMESFKLKSYNLYYPSTIDVGQFCPELGIGIISDGDSGGETDDVDCVVVYHNKPNKLSLRNTYEYSS